MRELLRLSRFLETLASEHGGKGNGRRRKRDTSHYLNDVVHEIQTQLENLETSMNLDKSAQSSSAENSNSTLKFGIKCFIESSGKVNCSSVIYENEKSWKKSRDQVDLLIQVLKTKIVELKDIRRHLKEHKPKNVTDSDDDVNEGEDVSENALASTEDSDETTEKVVNVQKQSRRPHHNINTNSTSKRPHRIHSTTSAMSSSSSLPPLSTTTSRPRTTTARLKITSTAIFENRTHPVAARKNNQSERNSTAPMKTVNLENNHRHHHQHHAKNSNSTHPTKRKMHEDSTQESIIVNTKSDKKEKIDGKFDQEVDQSRAECFCEPDTER